MKHFSDLLILKLIEILIANHKFSEFQDNQENLTQKHSLHKK